MEGGEFLMGILLILLLLLGIWMAVSPKSSLDFKIKMAAKMGAKLTVSKKTYQYARYIGIALIVLCVLALFG